VRARSGSQQREVASTSAGSSPSPRAPCCCRFVDDKFSPTFISTVGVDYKAKILPIEGLKVKLQVWDTAGQERFRSISVSFLRGA